MENLSLNFTVKYNVIIWLYSYKITERINYKIEGKTGRDFRGLLAIDLLAMSIGRFSFPPNKMWSSIMMMIMQFCG